MLLKIEKKLERKRKKKNDPRTCDIDIIDYKGETINLKFENFELNIPHKSLNERDFVLYPLNVYSFRKRFPGFENLPLPYIRMNIRDDLNQYNLI